MNPGDRAPPEDAAARPAEPSGFVQDADASERVIVLKVRVPGRTVFVIVGASKRAGLAGLLAHGTAREVWGGRLPGGADRKRAYEDALGGAHVLGVGAAEIFVERDGVASVVRAHGGRVTVGEGTAPADLPSFVKMIEDDAARTSLETRGRELALSIAADTMTDRRAATARVLGRAVARIDRRLEAIATDLGRIAEADAVAQHAPWFIAEAAKAPRGATRLVVTDWSTGEPAERVIALDPAKPAREQVEAMFKRQKRLRLGARVAEDRRAQALAHRDALARILTSIEEASDLGAIEELGREAKRIAPRDVVLDVGQAKANKAVHASRRRMPYRTFLARSGKKILVGKGAADNDALTLHVARPHDLWLHAKDRAGAHVIVPLDKGLTCPAEDLVEAAHLAAHFSEAKSETTVDVQYTPRRLLRKPKGSAPGFVLTDREKVLVLRVDEKLVRELLEREQLAAM